jgi:hypothetical protein
MERHIMVLMLLQERQKQVEVGEMKDTYLDFQMELNKETAWSFTNKTLSFISK